MDAIKVFALLVTTIIQLPQVVDNGLDEAAHECMQQRGKQLSQRITLLLQELELSGFGWGAPLLAALQQWRFWAVAGVLVLLFGLCWRLCKRSHQPDSSAEEDSSSSNTEKEEEEEQEEKEEQKEEEKHEEKDEQKEEEEHEEKEKKEEKAEQEEEEEESEGEDSYDERRVFRIYAKRIHWSVQSLAYRSRMVEELVGNLLGVFQERLSNSFFPVLQPAIGVGSAFEGWNPHEQDAVYRLLVPLKPPRGHAFHLELGTGGEMPAKFSCVRVELECTCTRDQPVENMLCFLHHPEEQLRTKQGASLLDTLCTDSYLDAQKTAHWFQDLVSSAWVLVPQSRRYNMKVLPSSRSCKLQLTNARGRTLFVEMMFGVQQGDSDIFLSSHATEAVFIPSTLWPESCAVAEVKFFRHMARQALPDTLHLKCLQLCARILVDTGFSTSTLKTVVMHLLNTIPLSSWSRREFLVRLQDILWYLHGCLEEKHLAHFFLGNENVPEDIILPPAFQTAEPFNLFQHLLQDPAAHAKALRDFDELQDRLTRLLFYGY